MIGKEYFDIRDARLRIAELTRLLDRLAYPERFPESGCAGWHSGDGPFEEWANKIADEYRALPESSVGKAAE
jgi:hypothetical protein